MSDDAPHVEPADRAEWRAWLAAHHGRPDGVWLVYRKKRAARPGDLTYDEAVEEALCFGWIDSKVQTHDEARVRQWLSPRRPGSIWSRRNKERVERVTAAGLMTPAGQAKIDAAGADGSWSRYDDVEDLIVPGDLATALEAAGARSAFDAFSPSVRKGVLFWIAAAKRPETRERRIERTARSAARGEPPVG
ncbi:MAG: YdeI/OmpD-associated family protein [Actinobacteria bacterium]|nr:YdeI/OmpD-associated family protein [Actinomycetota bacterium]